MSRPLNFVILFAFAITMLVALVSSTNERQPQDALQTQMTVSLLARAIGTFIATVAALALLLKAVSGETFEQTAVLTLPLLAGLLIVQVDWSLSLPLGALGVGVITKEILALFLRKGGAADAG